MVTILKNSGHTNKSSKPFLMPFRKARAFVHFDATTV